MGDLFLTAVIFSALGVLFSQVYWAVKLLDAQSAAINAIFKRLDIHPEKPQEQEPK